MLLLWINELEHKLRSAPLPDVIIDTKVTLGELLVKYAEEISPTHKGCVPETCRLKSIARKWIGELDIRYLTKQHFIQYRDDRLKVVKGGSVGSELALRKRVLDTAINKWGYGIPYNPIKDIEFPKGSIARIRRLVGDEKERLLIAKSSQRNIYIAPIIDFAIETSMRRSEILKLRWCDVDLENGFASLYDTKNGALDGASEYCNANGQLSQKGNYKNDKMEGFWEGYNEDGTVDTEYTGTFKNGVKVGN